ncbi:DUF2877 domain-containing protein [Candidatus Bathyarchaeota archaeon]|nr:DUF2877 domain-containing protein [Candidatus Bathyarchaeota archaeon]
MPNPYPLSIGEIAYDTLSKYGEGYVHSVFSNVINLRMNHDLVSLISQRGFNSPISLKIDKENFDGFIIKEKTAVSAKEEALTIGNGIKLSNLDKIETWIPKTNKKITSQIDKKTLQLISELIKIYGNPEGLKPLLPIIDGKKTSNMNIYSEKAAPIVRRIIESFPKELETAIQYASHLAGLGPGLTPSGDDLLMGLTCTLNLFGEHYSIKHEGFTQSILRGIEGKTNFISTAFIKHYAEGKPSENIDSFYLSILNGNPEAIEENIRKNCLVGHSSGTDTIIGVLIAFKLMRENENG